MTSLIGGALERIFQLLRGQVDHHLPLCTTIVRDEKHSPDSTKEKTRLTDMPSLALVPELWQAYRSLHHLETCEREHAYGNLRSLLMTFPISPAFLS